MNNKILLTEMILTGIILFFVNIAIATPPKIVTSITPIASIISMITKDVAKIVAIDASNGCPHHYHVRPSDKEKIDNAKLLVYIDDHFDSFSKHLFADSQEEVIQISDLESINFTDSNGQKNWHFWLSLDNILKLNNEFVSILSKKFPDLKTDIIKNQDNFKMKIRSLAESKKSALKSISTLVLLSDSLEHFFTEIDQNTKIIKLYQKQYPSLKYLSKIEKTLNSDSNQCIVIDNTQDPTLYKKFNKKIIQLESENWSVKDFNSEISDLFYTKYTNLINQLQDCITRI